MTYPWSKLSHIGPIGVLALGTYHRWEPRQIYVLIVTTYGDESNTHKAAPTMMLAGYVSTLGPWNTFENRWKRDVLKAGLPGYYHATEHWDTGPGAKFAPLADKNLRKNVRLGYVIELDKAAYEQCYIANKRLKKPQLDTQYSLCFRYLNAFLAVRLPFLLKREDIKLNYILEEGAAGSKDAHRVIQLLRKTPETQEFTNILADVPLSFGYKKKVPGLQASDRLAFAAGKYAESGPPMSGAIPETSTLREARAHSVVKPPIFHCFLGAEELTSLKSDLEIMVQFRKQMAAEISAGKTSE